MNWLDYVLIALLAFSSYRSFSKGFSREVIGLTASFLALVLGMWFYGTAASYIAPYTGSPRLANLGGFFVVVALVIAAGSLVGRIVRRFLRTVGLSFFDRTLGAGFGLLRGLFIAIALLTAYTAFGPPAVSGSEPDAVLHSQIAPYILDASHYFVAVAPMDLKNSFGTQYSEFKRALEKSVRERSVPSTLTTESGRK